MLPVVDLNSAIPFELSGSAAGGPGAAQRRDLRPGTYVVIVSGGEVLIRDGDAEALNETKDPPFRGDVVLAVRFKQGRVTVSTKGTEDAVLFLMPLEAWAKAVAGGAQLEGCR